MWSPPSSPRSSQVLARRATMIFNRVKEVDASLIEAGHKLASELHHIFHSQAASGSATRLLNREARQGELVLDLGMDSPLTRLDDLVHSPFSLQQHQYLPSSSLSVSLQSTPRLASSRSSLTSTESLHHEPSRDNDYSDYDERLVETADPETLNDPFWVSTVSTTIEEEERNYLRDASARAAFGLAPRTRNWRQCEIKMRRLRARSDEEMFIGAVTKPVLTRSEAGNNPLIRSPSVLRPSKSLIMQRSEFAFASESLSPRQQRHHDTSSCGARTHAPSKPCLPPLPLPTRRQTCR